MIYGYARVSTSDQETTMQIDALKVAGAQVVYQEKTSSIGDRPEQKRLLDSLQRGDTLIVWKMDRLARSLTDLLRILELFKRRGVAFRSLTEPVDTSNAIGEFLLQVLGAVAQLERSMIRERVIAGQVAAISRGGRHGRPSALDDAQKKAVLEWHRQGEKKAAIAARLGVSRWAVDRVICLDRNPAHPKYGPKRPVLGPLLEAVAKAPVVK